MKKTTIIMLMAAMAAISVSCTQKSKPTEFAVYAINDNENPQTMPASIFTGAADSLAQVLGLEQGIPASMNAILIEKEGEQILFDTGNGRENSQLLPKLEALGLTPQDIDLIFITHMHGDHIGGLVKDGKAVFENAKLYINEKEMNAWMNMPEERNEQVRAMASAYENKITRFDIDNQLPHGIQPIAAYGHTEGHTVYIVEDILIAGDLMHGVAIQLENPDICARFDGNLEQTIESRKAIIALAKEKGLRMYGMHFPEPHYLDFKTEK